MIIAIFLIIISQGSVASQIKCGEIFNEHFVANCPQTAKVKDSNVINFS